MREVGDLKVEHAAESFKNAFVKPSGACVCIQELSI